MRTKIIIVLIGILNQIGFAQNIDKAKLDNYFNVLEANNKFMGSVALSKDGKIIYTKVVGYSDVENNVKADENTKYRIGSISKTFTSVLILKAVENKNLSLNQTIDNYFPNIKNAEKITIKHLLNHRSGIHNFTNDKDYLSWYTMPKTEKEMVEIIAKAGSDFQPDTKAEYSNSNYVLLSYILEKTFKKSYAELLDVYIVQPVGLTDTYFGSKINPDKKECKSYTFLGTWNVQPETDTSVPLGAGGIISTPIDLVRFSDALFGGKIIKPESLEIMKTMEDHYGIGLFQFPFYDKLCYDHTGGIDGFSSVFSYSYDGNISYALISNGTNFNNDSIAITVLSAVYDKPYEIPEFSINEVSTEDLEKYRGIYSSKEIPLKINITSVNNTLIAQATGQSALPLEATEKDKFKFDEIDAIFEFDPVEKTMILKQAGTEFTFAKDKTTIDEVFELHNNKKKMKKMNEKRITTNDIELSTESFGNKDNPSILLIAGATVSMLYWDEEFCQRLADKGFYVIRYDSRDVGKSTFYETGTTPYDIVDLTDDAIAILDGYKIENAHFIGLSLGGLIAQIASIKYPERIKTLTLFSTGPWGDSDPTIPEMDTRVLNFHAKAGNVDWTNEDKVVEYMIEGASLMSGEKQFDQERGEKLIRAEFKRANNYISMFNHAGIQGGEEYWNRLNEINHPTLIIHGKKDLIWHYKHSGVLLGSIKNATLLTLEGTGHELHFEDWNTIIDGINKHIKENNSNK